MLIVVDYGRGNLFSLGQALRHLGVAHEITDDADKVSRASRLVLPGVGAFGDAMSGLAKRDLIEPLREAASRGVPLLGICLGMQMLASTSSEFGFHKGLDLVPGAVERLPEGDGTDATRIPNVGWRRLNVVGDDPLLRGHSSDSMVYFVHSFAPKPMDSSHVSATTPINGHDIPVIIQNGNVVGFQFHPEKSGAVGLGLLRRFVEFEPD